MSKKAEVYKKELEIKAPLVERLPDIRGQEFEYFTLLKHVENKPDYKPLPDDSELRLMRDSIPHLGIVAKLIVRDATEILIPKAARQEIIRTLHLTHAATDTMVLQTRNRLFWPPTRQ